MLMAKKYIDQVIFLFTPNNINNRDFKFEILSNVSRNENILQIEGFENKIFKITLLTSSNKVIRTFEIDHKNGLSSTSVDTSILSSGAYVLHIRSKDGQVNKVLKIVVTKN